MVQTRRRRPVTAQPIRIEKYYGVTQEDALRSFASDAHNAAASGYEPSGQSWENGALLVTYRYVGARRSTATEAGELLMPAGAIVIGGALVAVGSVLPWATVTGGFGLSASRSGIEGGDGLPSSSASRLLS
jgi:hypothetical protein